MLTMDVNGPFRKVQQDSIKRTSSVFLCTGLGSDDYENGSKELQDWPYHLGQAIKHYQDRNSPSIKLLTPQPNSCLGWSWNSRALPVHQRKTSQPPTEETIAYPSYHVPNNTSASHAYSHSLSCPTKRKAAFWTTRLMQKPKDRSLQQATWCQVHAKRNGSHTCPPSELLSPPMWS